MERALFVSWLLLAAVHVMPATVLFAPQLTERLYGVAPGGAVGILIVHRGALFLAVLAVAVLAAFSPDARRAASLVVGISVVAFLTLYAASGMPSGQLRTIALADAVALAPLALVTWAAWSR